MIAGAPPGMEEDGEEGEEEGEEEGMMGIREEEEAEQQAGVCA